jgi:hypothetical protein
LLGATTGIDICGLLGVWLGLGGAFGDNMPLLDGLFLKDFEVVDYWVRG